MRGPDIQSITPRPDTLMNLNHRLNVMALIIFTVRKLRNVIQCRRMSSAC